MNSVDLGEVTLLPFVFPNELTLANTQTLQLLKNPNPRICFIDFSDREEGGDKVRNTDVRERLQSVFGFHHQAPMKYSASVS